MRLIVAGSRKVQDVAFIFSELDRLTETHTPDEVISGGATGPDTIGAMWAFKHGITVKHMPADWNRHGKKAGFIRNNEMALVGTHLVAFWDGKSRGTKDMIDIAKKLGLEVRVIMSKRGRG